MTDPFPTPAAAAMALLSAHVVGDARLTRKAGSFLGQTVVDPTPLTEAQQSWISTLLDRAGLPPLANGGGDD